MKYLSLTLALALTAASANAKPVLKETKLPRDTRQALNCLDNYLFKSNPNDMWDAINPILGHKYEKSVNRVFNVEDKSEGGGHERYHLTPKKPVTIYGLPVKQVRINSNGATSEGVGHLSMYVLSNVNLAKAKQLIKKSTGVAPKTFETDMLGRSLGKYKEIAYSEDTRYIHYYRVSKEGKGVELNCTIFSEFN